MGNEKDVLLFGNLNFLRLPLDAGNAVVYNILKQISLQQFISIV